MRVRVEDGGLRPTREDDGAGQALEGHRGERVAVGRGTASPPRMISGARYATVPISLPVAVSPADRDTCEAEVPEERVVRLVDEDVLRLDVAMERPLACAASSASAT